MNYIKHVTLFDGLDISELDEINAKITWRKYPENYSLLNQDDNTHDVYLVAHGKVKSTTFSLSGKEIEYQTIGSGEFFGELSSIDAKKRSTSIVIVESSIIGKLSRNEFWEVIEKHPTVVRILLFRLSGMIRSLCGRIYEYSALDVSDRVRSEILRQAHQRPPRGNSVIIDQMPTHEEIANRVTTHREAVTKEFSYLYKNGYISKQSGVLAVPDLRKLQSLISDQI